MSTTLPGKSAKPSQAESVASTSGLPAGTAAAAPTPLGSRAEQSSTLLPERPAAAAGTPALPKSKTLQQSRDQARQSQPLAYDASFHGPASADRQYHDKAGCILLTAYWLFLLLLLVLSAFKTSHQWLQHPSNTVHTLCGSDLGPAQAEGYLWWPDASNTASSYCVEACPQAAGLVCVNTTSYVADTADGCISSTIVLTSIYASTDYFGYCLPADTTTTDWNALHAIVNTPAILLRVMLGDSARNWYLILGCAAAAVALGRFLMTMLSNDPALYLAVTFIGSVAFLALLGSIILFLVGVTHTAAPSSLTQLPTIAGLETFVFVLGICFLGSAVVYGFYLLLQLGSGRLMLGIRLIRTAQAPLREISYTEGLPLVTCCWLFVLGLYAYVVGLSLHALQVQNQATQSGLIFTRWLWFVGPVHGFGMIWTAAFMLAVLRNTIAILVSTWYWTVDPKSDKLEALAVPSALQQSMVSHSGSLALAALLFTLATPFQAVGAMLPSSKCIPEGSKARVRHFSSAAYVQMALHGYSLRHSLVTASHLLQRHTRRMHNCEGAAHAAVMPGKIMVTAAMTCAAVWLSQYCGAKHTFTVATVGVVTVAAYGICCAFLTMHEQAVEAMLQCFCEDCERNDGSAMHPYYMSGALKKVILDAETKKKGSRLFGAVKQIARAMQHALLRAVEPFQYALVRIVILWKDRSKPSGYRSVKQQPAQTLK